MDSEQPEAASPASPAAELRDLRAELARATAERDRLRSSLRELGGTAARRLANLQATVRAFTHFQAPLRAVAHDPALGPRLRVALADVLARPARPA